MNAGILRTLYDLGFSRASGIAALGDEAVQIDNGTVGGRAAHGVLRGWPDRSGRIDFEARATVRAGIAVGLVGWVRSAVAARTTDADVVLVERTFVRSTVDRSRLRRADLGPSDLAILDALAVAPNLRVAARQARAPRHSIASFVSFLRLVGALEEQTAAVDAPTDRRALAFLSLGLDRDAPASSVRATFRRLARLVHPDMHPHAPELERRALARRFAEIRAAYEELTVGG